MRKRGRKKRKPVPIPVASMGDIAFLLIIFFMLLSDFAKDRDLPIELPRSQEVQKTKATVAARVAIDENATVYLDGERVGGAKDVEWGVRALLARTVTDDQRHVQFKCDSKLSREKFEPVLKAIAEAGGVIEAVGEQP
ncbi:MAG: hypothetical protein GC164_09675 [Phycisphaera sp.]|nr:hypothetical protein [Phycisphaera sp.]